MLDLASYRQVKTKNEHYYPCVDSAEIKASAWVPFYERKERPNKYDGRL